MEAKHDAVVTDANGIQRKVFAGQTIPGDLIGAYRQAVSEQKDEPETATSSSSAKAEKAPAKDKAQRSAERDK